MKAIFFENNIPRIALTTIALKITKNSALSRFSPIRYTSVQEPELPNQRWLKTKNITCGLCGSDIHFIYLDIDPKCFPAAIPPLSRKYLGHEFVSEVIEIGSDVEGFKVGDRVVLRIDWPSCYQLEFDPPCKQCKAGNYMLCENQGKRDVPILDNGGGFSPYMVMHRTQPHRVPDNIDNDEAVFIEPTACAVHGVFKYKPQKNEKVLVIGCGAIGLLTIAVAKAIEPKCNVYALVKYPFQADAAITIGADDVLFSSKDLYNKVAEKTDANLLKGFFGNKVLLGGFDVVYDSIGNDNTINDSLRLVKAGGHVIVLGINFRPGKIDYTPIWFQEAHLLGTNSHANESETENSFDVATRLIAEKKIHLDGLITHRFKLDKFKDAVNTFINKKETKAIKIVIDHQ